MPLPPQKFREAVLQILFSQDYERGDEIVPFMMEELKTTRRAMSEAYERAGQIREKLDEIDEKITKASTEYSFERISRVERSVLRLSLYELLFDATIPPKV